MRVMEIVEVGMNDIHAYKGWWLLKLRYPDNALLLVRVQA